MALDIRPKDATVATVAMSCLVGATAFVLISSVYLTHNTGWPQLALSAFCAAAVCTVGALALGYAAYQQFVVKHSLFADHGDEFEYRSIGQWAVVTGATDGIGKEYARQLAVDHGMDLLLVGRNPDKLRAVAEMIRNKTAGRGRRVITVVADFAEEPVARRGVPCGSAAAADGDRDERRDEPYRDEPDRDDLGDRCHCGASAAGGAGSCARWYPRLRAAVDSRPLRDGGVGVLVNCAGVSYPHPEFFAGMLGDGPAGHGDRDGPWGFTAEFCDGADAAVRCNAAAAVHACRLVLPGMLARGRGLVVNVGSASSSVSPGAPLMTLYAATKKFLEKLSADLDDECVYLNRDNRDGGHGVRVQCVRPAYVATAMLRSANPDVRAAPAADGRGGDCSDSDADLSDHEEYGNEDWWAVRRGRFERAVERWMVPSARRWVRSALRQGGRLYARRTCWPGADGPANFVGYWPHALLMAAMRLASALTPRRWYVDHVLIPGMLKYRRKGRAAVVEAERQREQWRRRSVARSDGRE